MITIYDILISRVKGCNNIYILGMGWIMMLSTLTLLYLLFTEDISMAAPTDPVDTVIKTVCSSGCNYKSIQDAIDASSSGWTIQVKNGTYREKIAIYKTCTESRPCTLEAYPGHSPKIDGTGQDSNGISLRGSWWIIDGFEITKARFDGFKVGKPHNTFRDNYVHNNSQSGIKINSGASDILVEGNISEYNGTDSGACIFNGRSSPKHCHAVYLNPRDPCSTMTGIVIRKNALRNEGGAGIQINNQGCGDGVKDFIWENNLIQNVTVAFQLFHNNRYGTIRNNTVVIKSYPRTDTTVFAFFNMTGDVTGHKVYNNILYTTRSDIKGFVGTPNVSSQKYNDFNYNSWTVVSNRWTWLGSSRDDFKSAWISVTGWDRNGECCTADPGFADVSGDDYSLSSDSPAIDAGTNSECASNDIDGFLRLVDGFCDIGMFEFVSPW